MPTFFTTAEAFRGWLETHGADAGELIVGFYKLGSGLPSITWPQAVDEALCHGWIDGVRNRIDERSYRIRFTPRRPTSTWSAINIDRVRVLRDEGRMTPRGLDAFAARHDARSAIYSYEQAEASMLAPDEEALFRRARKAWAFFEAQPPGYRRLNIHRIVSAKRPRTRAARLARLIEASHDGERL